MRGRADEGEGGGRRCGIRERGGERRPGGATVKKQYGRVRLLQVCLTPPRTGSPRARTLRTLRLRTLRFFPPRQQLRAHRSRFNLHTTDHVFRLAFTSSSPYLATIDQAPIVFASTHPHLATGIGRLRAGGCSLVTTPHVRLLYARTPTLCGPSAVENLANERFSFYR